MLSDTSHLQTPDNIHIKDFINSGKFVEGTKFERTDRKTKQGRKLYWRYYCPICAKDEFTKAGLCSGWFESAITGLKGGKLSCRCSPCFRFSKEQREFQLKCIIKSEGNLTFEGWVGEYKNCHSRFLYSCDIEGHELVEVSLNNFLHKQSRCPSCSEGGFKKELPGYFYIFKTYEGQQFVGYGITNFIKDRIQVHDLALRKAGLSANKAIVFEMTGLQAFELEKLIKSQYPRFRQDIEGFKTEATYGVFYRHIIDTIEEFLNEDYDGT